MATKPMFRLTLTANAGIRRRTVSVPLSRGLTFPEANLIFAMQKAFLKLPLLQGYSVGLNVQVRVGTSKVGKTSGNIGGRSRGPKPPTTH
jgi:hypothetical protein